ncbi:ArsR/SmtB family transcription factor [Micromonospora sp. CB01531]|uniref:ArsR/SmtB family transcription factor n=1 Tax=Micromonospora sp. CB01531 TaxID=1718947 RepID=UPI00093B235E|nr:helix-turn-helix domain-containing protein [Micromonospora sp. CB01531]OKI89381.1 transcriptional regulator [Micromonospora sp. CB01531]
MTTLHLNAADLSRTVLRSAPAVLLELGSAGQRLFQAGIPDHLAEWRGRTRAALRSEMRPYLDLCRLPHWFPDFLTPPRLGSDLGTALDEVAGAPTEALAAELCPRIDAGDLPPRVAALAAGDPDARAQLQAAMVAFYAVAVAPYWETITAAVGADRAVRGHTMLDAGIDRVLRDLSPYLSWTSSGERYELAYRCAVADDLELVPGGRGVTLVPSYFVPQPCVLDDPDGPLVLAYPIRPARRKLTTGRPLADLLGRTRAAVLAAVVDGPSTSQLARALGISVASASQHASTLRAAGLITSHRDGATVRHALTPLGEHLLRAGRPR